MRIDVILVVFIITGLFMITTDTKYNEDTNCWVEHADQLFSLPDKLILDVESFMARKAGSLETPRGKVGNISSKSQILRQD